MRFLSKKADIIFLLQNILHSLSILSSLTVIQVKCAEQIVQGVVQLTEDP